MKTAYVASKIIEPRPRVKCSPSLSCSHADHDDLQRKSRQYVENPQRTLRKSNRVLRQANLTTINKNRSAKTTQRKVTNSLDVRTSEWLRVYPEWALYFWMNEWMCATVCYCVLLCVLLCVILCVTLCVTVCVTTPAGSGLELSCCSLLHVVRGD